MKKENFNTLKQLLNQKEIDTFYFLSDDIKQFINTKTAVQIKQEEEVNIEYTKHQLLISYFDGNKIHLVGRLKAYSFHNPNYNLCQLTGYFKPTKYVYATINNKPIYRLIEILDEDYNTILHLSQLKLSCDIELLNTHIDKSININNFINKNKNTIQYMFI